MKQLLVKLWNDNSGADMVEYALIAAIISLAAISVMPTVGQKILAVFTDISNNLVAP